MSTAQYRDLCEGFRKKIDGIRAVVLVSLDGSILDRVGDDGPIRAGDLASEYATLFRIASRTSQDAGTGEVIEHVVVSDRSTVVARKISPELILMVVTDPDHIGRTRYELKRIALGM